MMTRRIVNFRKAKSKMEGGTGRRIKCRASIGDILLIGEQLRVLMHTDNPHLIKDRRHKLRACPCCFVGSEIVDWLVQTEQAPDREMAAYLMTLLLENNIFHHVSDEYPFRDDNQYYRFRKDDGTFPWHEDMVVLMRAQKLFHCLLADGADVLGVHEEMGITYPASFFGSQLVDWLISTGSSPTRDLAVKDCRKYLENDILRHVTDGHHFKDEAILYQFKMDFTRNFDLMDLVRPASHRRNDRSLHGTPERKMKGLKIPRVKTQRAESGYHSHGDDCASSYSTSGSPVPFGGSDCGTPSNSSMLSMTIGSPAALLMRKATIDELDSPTSPYRQRHVRIASDPVGFGFVIRGEGPVFIKTVDPTGPAAMAGLKVGHYILKVNDIKVLHMNHRDLATLILSCMGYLRLVVMEHPSDSTK